MARLMSVILPSLVLVLGLIGCGTYWYYSGKDEGDKYVLNLNFQPGRLLIYKQEVVYNNVLASPKKGNGLQSKGTNVFSVLFKEKQGDDGILLLMLLNRTIEREKEAPQIYRPLADLLFTKALEEREIPVEDSVKETLPMAQFRLRHDGSVADILIPSNVSEQDRSWLLSVIYMQSQPLAQEYYQDQETRRWEGIEGLKLAKYRAESQPERLTLLERRKELRPRPPYENGSAGASETPNEKEEPDKRVSSKKTNVYSKDGVWEESQAKYKFKSKVRLGGKNLMDMQIDERSAITLIQTLNDPLAVELLGRYLVGTQVVRPKPESAEETVDKKRLLENVNYDSKLLDVSFVGKQFEVTYYGSLFDENQQDVMKATAMLAIDGTPQLTIFNDVVRGLIQRYQYRYQFIYNTLCKMAYDLGDSIKNTIYTLSTLLEKEIAAYEAKSSDEALAAKLVEHQTAYCPLEEYDQMAETMVTGLKNYYTNFINVAVPALTTPVDSMVTSFASIMKTSYEKVTYEYGLAINKSIELLNSLNQVNVNVLLEKVKEWRQMLELSVIKNKAKLYSIRKLLYDALTGIMFDLDTLVERSYGYISNPAIDTLIITATTNLRTFRDKALNELKKNANIILNTYRTADTIIILLNKFNATIASLQQGNTDVSATLSAYFATAATNSFTPTNFDALLNHYSLAEMAKLRQSLSSKDNEFVLQMKGIADLFKTRSEGLATALTNFFAAKTTELQGTITATSTAFKATISQNFVNYDKDIASIYTKIANPTYPAEPTQYTFDQVETKFTSAIVEQKKNGPEWVTFHNLDGLAARFQKCIDKYKEKQSAMLAGFKQLMKDKTLIITNFDSVMARSPAAMAEAETAVKANLPIITAQVEDFKTTEIDARFTALQERLVPKLLRTDFQKLYTDLQAATQNTFLSDAPTGSWNYGIAWQTPVGTAITLTMAFTYSYTRTTQLTFMNNARYASIGHSMKLSASGSGSFSNSNGDGSGSMSGDLINVATAMSISYYLNSPTNGFGASASFSASTFACSGQYRTRTVNTEVYCWNEQVCGKDCQTIQKCATRDVEVWSAQTTLEGGISHTINANSKHLFP